MHNIRNIIVPLHQSQLIQILFEFLLIELLQIGDPLFGETAYPLTVETTITGTRIAYGAGGRIGPVLYAESGDADVWGWLTHPNLPGLLSQDFGGWRSVWSAPPHLPAVLLRFIARKAGVHVYTDVGDQVLAGAGLLAVHAAGDGNRKVVFPSLCTVSDALSGELVAEAAECIQITMRKGDTALWRLCVKG